MAAAIPYIGLALSVGGTIAQGAQQEQALNLQQRQLNEQAKTDVALSQLDAREERKRAEFLQSRLRALAGVSGTSIDSPDIQKQEAEIDAQGAYNSLAALYSGRSSARTKRLAARSRTYDSSQTYLRAAGQVISAGAQNEWW